VLQQSFRSRLTWAGGGLGAMTVVTVPVQVPPPFFGAGLIVTGILSALAALLTSAPERVPSPKVARLPQVTRCT
jgi:hypothetical protein